MSVKIVRGVFAALVTPRTGNGQLDCEGLGRQIEWLLGRGVRGFVINGATGEYALNSAVELALMAKTCREVLAGRGEFLCGIGSAGIRDCLEKAGVAADGGARGVLLPAPHFFSYEQDDLDAFCRAVAASVPLPILLYNLPQFTHNGYLPATVRSLVESVPSIVGIKDSSGSLDSLRALASSRVESCRIVGNDSVFGQGLAEGICDGVISGIACAVPELLVALSEAGGDPKGAAFAEAQGRLEVFISRICKLPVPWGLKWIQECRGIVEPGFSQPVSTRRQEEAKILVSWFREWAPTIGLIP